MTVQTKDHKSVSISLLAIDKLPALVNYLDKLSQATRRRFEPHSFDSQSVTNFYQDANHRAYIAESVDEPEIVAYFIIKRGFLPKEAERLESYGLQLSAETDCTFAPSVADAWQSSGVGNLLFRMVLNELQTEPFERMILWGGVQSSNERAIRFYEKYGFRELGYFEHNGIGNYDMIKELKAFA
ncbi:GNAT family N-acetyltransferase [Spirosoma sp. SC4-14]|uniref:GNAT family N-acetyltransferase n=1 Tax=Spirosoma sp. SC4-14 TaxID=3128900 RepID=UPI0030CDC41F